MLPLYHLSCLHERCEAKNKWTCEEPVREWESIANALLFPPSSDFLALSLSLQLTPMDKWSRCSFSWFARKQSTFSLLSVTPARFIITLYCCTLPNDCLNIADQYTGHKVSFNLRHSLCLVGEVSFHHSCHLCPAHEVESSRTKGRECSPQHNRHSAPSFHCYLPVHLEMASCLLGTTSTCCEQFSANLFHLKCNKQMSPLLQVLATRCMHVTNCHETPLYQCDSLCSSETLWILTRDVQVKSSDIWCIVKVSNVFSLHTRHYTYSRRERKSTREKRKNRLSVCVTVTVQSIPNFLAFPLSLLHTSYQCSFMWTLFSHSPSHLWPSEFISRVWKVSLYVCVRERETYERSMNVQVCDFHLAYVFFILELLCPLSRALPSGVS